MKFITYLHRSFRRGAVVTMLFRSSRAKRVSFYNDDPRMVGIARVCATLPRERGLDSSWIRKHVPLIAYLIFFFLRYDS